MVDAALRTLRVHWDTPYRLLASLLGLGCLCTLFGWLGATSPLDALVQGANYLGAYPVSNVIQVVDEWMMARSSLVLAFFSLLLLLGILLNQGGEGNRGAVPNHWRGAPTAIIALAAIWQVDPSSIRTLTVWAGVFVIIACIAAWRSDRFREWLSGTLVNFVGSFCFIFIIPLWMLMRNTPQTRRKSEE